MLLPDPFPIDGIKRSIIRSAFDITKLGRKEYSLKKEDSKEDNLEEEFNSKLDETYSELNK